MRPESTSGFKWSVNSIVIIQWVLSEFACSIALSWIRRPNRGVLVTSSHFTQDARAWAERNAIELISGLELVVLLNQYFGSEWPARVDFLIAMSRLRHPDPP